MKTRILSGLIMVPFLLVFYFGGMVLLAACLFIGLLGVYEFYKGFHALEIRPSYPVAVFSTIALYACYGVAMFQSGVILNIGGRAFRAGGPEGAITLDGRLLSMWMFLVMVASFLYLFRIDKRQLSDAMATILGVFYVVFFSFHVLLVDMAGKASILVWLIVLSAFGTDIMAYFCGVAFGKHKLCPTISPKKTIEGSIGGVAGAVILCGLFGLLFARGFLVHCLIIGALGGGFSQLGDLTASIFKRKMGIKDYGNLIPGHGGILDRFDSVLFTGPMVYYYLLVTGLA